jgi:5'-nucleotidase
MFNWLRVSMIFLLFSLGFNACAGQTTTIQILSVNDFHGQISEGRKLNDRPVGSAPVLASYLKNAQEGMENNTLITLMGDQISASPPASGLLKDEPTILFLNLLANKFCGEKKENRFNPNCNMVATVGNHEFDKGQKNLFEIIEGRNTPPTDNWIDLPRYPGAYFPYISANIVDEKTGEPIFTPYVIKKINGVTIAFIGAILKNAPDVILPSSIKGIKFLDEAEAINHYIPEIKKQNVDAIVVITHQGGMQVPYEGATKEDTKVDGAINDMVKKLDDNVDVVMAGHTHSFTNAFLKNQNGKKILVTEANSYSASFADVFLTIDTEQHKVTSESAKIINAYADQFPGNTPDAEAARIVKLAEDKIAPIVNSHVGTAENDLTKNGNAAGESNLGDLISDSMRAAMQTDIAIMQPGGIRADVYAGEVTWGKLYAVQPFSNSLVKLSLTGEDLYNLFEQQWGGPKTYILQISGISEIYDASKPLGSRIVSLVKEGQPIQRNKIYTITTNEFLALGGDGFTVLKKGTNLESGPLDLDAFVSYVKKLPQPFSVKVDGRIQKL